MLDIFKHILYFQLSSDTVEPLYRRPLKLGCLCSQGTFDCPEHTFQCKFTPWNEDTSLIGTLFLVIWQCLYHCLVPIPSAHVTRVLCDNPESLHGLASEFESDNEIVMWHLLEYCGMKEFMYFHVHVECFDETVAWHVLSAFRAFSNRWKSLYMHGNTNSHCWAICFWKPSHCRTSRHHWPVCRGLSFYAISVLQMVQWIPVQLLASTVVPNMWWHYNEILFFFSICILAQAITSLQHFCKPELVSPNPFLLWGLAMRLSGMEGFHCSHLMPWYSNLLSCCKMSVGLVLSAPLSYSRMPFVVNMAETSWVQTLLWSGQEGQRWGKSGCQATLYMYDYLLCRWELVS